MSLHCRYGGGVGTGVGDPARRAKLNVLSFKPANKPAGWATSSISRTLASMPGTKIWLDDEGREAARFGAVTSGQLLIYDAEGRLRFSGGITVMRRRAASVQAAMLWKPCWTISRLQSNTRPYLAVPYCRRRVKLSRIADALARKQRSRRLRRRGTGRRIVSAGLRKDPGAHGQVVRGVDDSAVGCRCRGSHVLVAADLERRKLRLISICSSPAVWAASLPPCRCCSFGSGQAKRSLGTSLR